MRVLGVFQMNEYGRTLVRIWHKKVVGLLRKYTAFCRNNVKIVVVLTSLLSVLVCVYCFSDIDLILFEGSDIGNASSLELLELDAYITRVSMNDSNFTQTRSQDLLDFETVATGVTFHPSLLHCMKSQFVECPVYTPRIPDDPSPGIYGGKTFLISFLNKPSWMSSEMQNLSTCRFNQCLYDVGPVTQNTDVVVFHGVNIREEDLPQQRWSHQLYALAAWESPVHMNADFLSNEDSVWNHHINVTITYRTDADVFTPYFRLRFSPRPVKSRPNYYKIARKKTKDVVWIVSNCNVQSKRHEYVRRMRKYIDVDIIGSCGRQCLHDECLTFSQYKFYLSFENSLCQDYVTEKFFKLFAPDRHVIPVVRGWVDYRNYFPRYTFVDAALFSSAKSLALSLKRLGSDLDTYSKYLEIKDMYLKVGDITDMGCRLCDYLHTRNFSSSKTYNLKSWMGDEHCHEPRDL